MQKSRAYDLSIILFLVILLLLPFAFADISIKTDQNTYNLGNSLKVSASILQANNFEGLFKMTLSCDSYNLPYFLTPVSLEANYRSAVTVPDLKITPLMLGNCTIIGDLATNDNLIAEEKESSNFEVTDQLAVLPVKAKITSLPADIVPIVGVVNEAFGSNVLNAASKIVLDNSSYDADVIDGNFNATIKIPKNIASGRHEIGIAVSDLKGNAGSALIELDITAVPTYIKTDLSGHALLPGSKLLITSSLYDQANDLINVSLYLELKLADGTTVFTKTANSNEQIEHEFSQYAPPGKYLLKSTYKSLFTEDFINISEVKDIHIKYENETVLIQNIGNINFVDELTFILESQLKKYPITKSIMVEPGKSLSIDLSKEVPLGIYNIKVPIKEAMQNIAASAQEGISSLLPGNESLLANDVTIHDNRPVYKKIASGISSISGALTGAEGLLTKNPILAPLTLIIILGVIIFHYGRKPITNFFKKKKEDK